MNRMREWLSEEEMPDRNVDGTPMVNGVDLNGRPYGRSAAWEDDPWHVAADRVYGPSPLGEASGPDHNIGAASPRDSCTVWIVVIAKRRRCVCRCLRGARFHRSASSRRARRWRRDAASRDRRIVFLRISVPADIGGFDSGSATSTDAGR